MSGGSVKARIYIGFLVLCVGLGGCSTARRLGADVAIMGPVHLEPELFDASDLVPAAEAVWTLKRPVADSLPRRTFAPHLLEVTSSNLETEARRRGYLNAQVECEPDSSWGHRVGMTCRMAPGPLAVMGVVSWKADSSGLPVQRLAVESRLKAGAPFDVTLLEKERSRIAAQAKSLGFAGFDEAYVGFDVDTAGVSVGRPVQVEVSLRPAVVTRGGRLVNVAHGVNRFGSIRLTQLPDDLPLNQLRPEIVEYLMSIERGMVYNSRVLEDTYRRLAKLPSVRRVELRLESRLDGTDSLDVDIRFSFRDRMAMELELDMTRRDAAYGPLAQFSWQHLNPSGMGDRLEFTASGGVSSVKPFAYDRTSLVPNSGEWASSLTYERPGMFPLPLRALRPSSEARTEVQLGYRRESRPDYFRRSLTAGWSNRFVENPARQSQIRVDWLEVTHSDIEATEAFSEWLNTNASDFIRSRFADYSSLLTRVAWQMPGTHLSVEWAGQILRQLAPSLGATLNATDQYLVAGVPFAQFVRLEGQKAWHFGRGRVTQAARILGGIGWAGANFSTLPFDRSFFGGGVQGMRGWGARSLGPGNHDPSADTDVVTGLGDMRWEGSWEVRWRWTDMWMAAGFMDVGNVWLHGEGAPAETTFRGSGLGSLGWNCGAGLRLDFEFFLLRLDAGLRLHDPSLEAGARWIGQGPMRGALHLGLGHPF
jgi:hypothetical protein